MWCGAVWCIYCMRCAPTSGRLSRRLKKRTLYAARGFHGSLGVTLRGVIGPLGAGHNVRWNRRCAACTACCHVTDDGVSSRMASLHFAQLRKGSANGHPTGKKIRQHPAFSFYFRPLPYCKLHDNPNAFVMCDTPPPPPFFFYIRLAS